MECRHTASNTHKISLGNPKRVSFFSACFSYAYFFYQVILSPGNRKRSPCATIKKERGLAAPMVVVLLVLGYVFYLRKLSKGYEASEDEMIDKKEEEFYPLEGRFGNGPAVYYQLPDFQGKIGLISALHGKFCDPVHQAPSPTRHSPGRHCSALLQGRSFPVQIQLFLSNHQVSNKRHLGKNRSALSIEPFFSLARR